MKVWPWALVVTVALQLSLVPGAAQTELLEKIELDLRDELLAAGPRDVFHVWVRFWWEPNDDYPRGFPEYVEQVSMVPRVEFEHAFERTSEMSVKAVAEAIFEIATFPFVMWIEPVGYVCLESPCEPPELPPWEDEARGKGFQTADLGLSYLIAAPLVLGLLGIWLRFYRA